MALTLVVGDVHGCAKELEALVQLAQPTQIILVGDLFTKGPDPLGVWELIQAYDMRSVLGNHDDWLLQQFFAGSEHPVLQVLNTLGTRWVEWLQGLPLFAQVQGYTIVHAGLHPSGIRARTTRTMALTMRRWPDQSSPPWHEQYRGESPVIFGHDAKQGLIYKKRNNQPYLIGLDTGCTYGKQLTGFILEEQQLLSVQARQAYTPINVKTTDLFPA